MQTKSFRNEFGIADQPEWTSFQKEGEHGANLIGFIIQPKFNEKDNPFLISACSEYNSTKDENVRLKNFNMLKGKVRELAVLKADDGKQYSASSQKFAEFNAETEQRVIVSVAMETSPRIKDENGKEKPFAVVKAVIAG